MLLFVLGSDGGGDGEGGFLVRLLDMVTEGGGGRNDDDDHE